MSIFSTPQSTSDLTASLVQYLNKELAPRITRHGVLVEVYGEGCLLTGDSGVGKSETAIELIKRGHRLVADDAVEIRRTAQTTLYASRPKISATSLSFEVSELSMPENFSVWVLSSCRKRLIW